VGSPKRAGRQDHWHKATINFHGVSTWGAMRRLHECVQGLRLLARHSGGAALTIITGEGSHSVSQPQRGASDNDESTADGIAATLHDEVRAFARVSVRACVHACVCQVVMTDQVSLTCQTKDARTTGMTSCLC
jgi:hypothetical protein